MGSDRQVYLDDRVDDRPGDGIAGRSDGGTGPDASVDTVDRGDGGVDRAWPDRRRVLSELYQDDPDDVFAGQVPVERRRMGLDEQLDDGRTARHFLEEFDSGRLNRSDPGRPTPPDGMDGMEDMEGQERCVRRVYAAFGGSGFHGAERHEGSLDDQDHLLRLVERQDPAQCDEVRRARGMDAFKKGNGKHVCAESSTSICDPVAYAVALARGVDHPAVRAALDARHDPPRRPHYVHVPIVELLGESGDEFCRGHQLVGADPREAVKQRDVWAKAGWKGKPRDGLCPPPTEQITTFRNGVIEFRIGHNAASDSYELISMFPRPRSDRTEGSDRD